MVRGSKHTQEAKLKNKLAHLGKVAWNKGLTQIEDEGRKKPNISGENHWNWQGGITKINLAVRNSLEYKLWRGRIFERDNYTCQICGKNRDLNVDHYPESYFMYNLS